MYNLITMETLTIYIFKEDSNPEDYLTYFSDYYLPITGGKPFSLYMSLKNLVNTSLKEDELVKLLGVSRADYLTAKRVLEGVGLIKSYQKEEVMFLILYPVLPPSEFFNRRYLTAALYNALYNDKDKYQKIYDKYRPKYDLTGFNNVSSGFMDLFETVPSENNGERTFKIKYKTPKSDNTFSYSIFLRELKKMSQINAKMISEEEEEKIETLATLYNVKEFDMARYITMSFDALNKEKRIDLKKVEEEIIANSAVSEIKFNRIDQNKPSKVKTSNNMIKYYQSVGPIEFLRETLKGKEPSLEEKKIITMLSNTYHFSGDMIVAILDYALNKDNGRLYKFNIERYADIVLRNGASDLYSLLDTLYNEKTIKEAHKNVEIKVNNKNNNIETNSLFNSKNDETYNDDVSFIDEEDDEI